MDQGDIVKAHCNQCAGERKHLMVHFYKTDWNEIMSDDPPARIHGEDRYELLQCAGCDAITLRHTSYHSEITDDNGRNIPTVTYYPPSTFRKIPSWTHGASIGDKSILIIWMPEFVSRLIPEIYTSLHNVCYGLAAMGVRALLESIMIQQVGDKGSFQKNLTAFQNAGGISPRQKSVIEATLEVGHASIHRGYAPSRTDIVSALDMVEGLIEMIYINEAKAEALRKRIPPKTKKTRSDGCHFE